MAIERLLYCLTRDSALAERLTREHGTGLSFFYNDAGRLNVAVVLRAPDAVVIDTDAIRPEYGDAGLGPVLDQLRQRAPGARLAVRPGPRVERFVAIEAGRDVLMLPADRDACAAAAARLFD